MTSRDYPGVAPDALWKAAVGAAESPRYTDWMVTENGVFVDEPGKRIEIYRELTRDHAPLGAALQRQSEIWTFSVRVQTDDRIPKVVIDTRSTLRSRGFWKQTDHFFGEIDSRLAQRPPVAPVSGETPAAAEGAAAKGAAQPPMQAP